MKYGIKDICNLRICNDAGETLSNCNIPTSKAMNFIQNIIKEESNTIKLTEKEIKLLAQTMLNKFKENDNMNKSPLGIMPKHIYEIQRVQDICRALQEYSCYDQSINNCELMIDWSEELNERLNHLKYDMEDNENIMLK